MKNIKFTVIRFLFVSISFSFLTIASAVDDAKYDLVQSDANRDFAVSISNDDMRRVVDGNRMFSFDLYHRLKNNDENLIFSPFSLSAVLAMTWAGTSGITENEMRDVLNFIEPPEITHKAFNMIDLIMTNQFDLKIETANSIWAQKDETWKKDFLDTLKINYSSGVYNADFISQSETARKDINQWVEENTKGKFKELIESGQINSLTRMVLVNTLYFYGQWVNLFNKDATKDEPFTLLNKSKVNVRMMNEKNMYFYMVGDGFKAIILNYGPEMSFDVHAHMIVILPDIDRFTEIESKISTEFIDGIKTNLKYDDVHLKFPKFDFKERYILSNTFADMGMPSAFASSSADFSNMSDRTDLFISDIIQNAFIKVDEEGTEAGAASAVIVCMGMIHVQDVFEFFVDHPFIFIIEETGTNSILFMGRVLDPRQR